MGEQEEEGNHEYEADRNASQEASCAGRWEGGRGFRADGHNQHQRGHRNPRTFTNGGTKLIPGS